MPTERTLTLVLAAAVLAPAAGADDVYLKSGGQLSGRIVSRSATKIEVDVGAGVIGVPAASVLRIEEGRSALHEYQERANRVAPGDVEAWLALGEWASDQGLGSQAREAYSRAQAAAPNDPRANEALGNVHMNGRWVSEDEAYQARGYVRYGGEWITPAEHEAMLRERAVEAQIEHEQREGEIRAREAEARAQEAEARARQAAAEAAEQTSEGLPLWYGWGAGPTAWPSGPIITPYVAPLPGVVPQ
jgi:hypothetical protein